MKSKPKSKVLFLITLVAILALLPTINSNLIFGGVNSNTIADKDIENLKLSKISGKIHIDGNSEWLAFKNDGNCTGSGTWSDPYVIQDLVIDGEGSGSCIWIENSDAYFIVRNCSLYNSGSPFEAGIKLDNADNGKIINNNCSDNIFFGIYLDYSDNNTVSGNTANDNIESGIILYDYSDNNIISGNTANNNSYGIALSNSDNNTLLGNNANNNSYGIYLQGSNNSTLSGNNASNNHGGIYFQQADFNTLSGNTANNNNFGIYISVSNNNTLSGNTASNNNKNGIYLGYNNNNTKIFLNHFINNEIKAADYGINNTWDDGFTGNYWDDYGGVDANDDGIGDTPYTILGVASAQDNYPIFWDAPIISIDSPVVNTTFQNTAPQYNISIEGVPVSMWYTIEGIVGTFPITELTGTVDQDTWDSLDDGDITITFYAQDSESEIGSTSIIVIKYISSTPTPDGIPGYNLFFLLGTISVVAIVISIKLKKFNK